jgi:hypothetical protein
MASRPIFVPDQNAPPYVKDIMIEFKWYPGFAKSQAQKSIASLHAVAARQGITPALEISSKSDNRLGVALSAFNLFIKPSDGMGMSVECAFQGSKIFEGGGPFTDLYQASSIDAKRDERLRNSGNVIGFYFIGEKFPITPLTVFYDWLYLHALAQNEKLSTEIINFKGFTDIAFNPQKSFNCQARSAALFVALTQAGLMEMVMRSKEDYLKIITGEAANNPVSETKVNQLKFTFGNTDDG